MNDIERKQTLHKLDQLWLRGGVESDRFLSLANDVWEHEQQTTWIWWRVIVVGAVSKAFKAIKSQLPTIPLPQLSGFWIPRHRFIPEQVELDRWHKAKQQEQEELMGREIEALRLTLQEKAQALQAIHDTIEQQMIAENGYFYPVLKTFTKELEQIYTLSQR